MPRPTRFAALLLLSIAAQPALATFPTGPIDCDYFDLDSMDFLGHNFGFGTELMYSDSTQPTLTTGLEGFMATPEQVAQIPEFVNGADLPTGGQAISDLFTNPITPPPTLQEGAVWQSIQGEGSFGGGFTNVTLNQRKLFEGAQDDGGFANLFGQGKAYAPFYAMSDSPEPIDVKLTIDLFSFFDVTGGGGLSEALGGALVDVTDPENPMFMDGVSGFYFADDQGVFADFGMGQEGETDVTDNFTSGPENTGPDSRQIASFFYSIDTHITPGNTYGLGLFGDGAIDLSGASSASLDSQNTLSVSIEVLTPGATLLLPGGVVPEPTSGLLALASLGLGLCRRRVS